MYIQNVSTAVGKSLGKSPIIRRSSNKCGFIGDPNRSPINPHL